MKKNYKHPEKEQDENPINEPLATCQTNMDPFYKSHFDSHKEYLLQEIEEGEKDIEEGRVIPLEEAIKKILG